MEQPPLLASGTERYVTERDAVLLDCQGIDAKCDAEMDKLLQFCTVWEQDALWSGLAA